MTSKSEALRRWATLLIDEGNSLGETLLDYANAWREEVSLTAESVMPTQTVGQFLREIDQYVLCVVAQDVVARWGTPMWKDDLHMGHCIESLRMALALNPAPPETPNKGDDDGMPTSADAIGRLCADHARVLALQQASYEREIQTEVEIERARCAKYLQDAAERLVPEGTRANQVDRHIANVLATKADELRLKPNPSFEPHSAAGKELK